MKEVPGYPNYSITKDGRVWTQKDRHGKARWLKLCLDTRAKYLSVNLIHDGKRYTRLVHRLVLETYVGPRPDGMECRHLNGNSIDNRLKNLKWGTRSENTYDSVRHGTHSRAMLGKFGENHPASKLSDRNRRLIFSLYCTGSHTQRELAERFEVAQSRVNHIVNNNRWRI